jgi:AcrR family transcriptional regulator
VSPTTKRATPLSRQERRQAILTAVIPLLIEKGTAVTTAEMAEAAGIAEGTIFRAFPDKAELLHEAVKTAMDPRPVQEALAAIPADLSLEEQLTGAAEVLGSHFDRITALVGMLRSLPHAARKPAGDTHRYAVDSLAGITAALAAILERHRDVLAMQPDRVAVALCGLVFTNAHPLLAAKERLSVREIVAIMLRGVGATR